MKLMPSNWIKSLNQTINHPQFARLTETPCESRLVRLCFKYAIVFFFLVGEREKKKMEYRQSFDTEPEYTDTQQQHTAEGVCSQQIT